MRDETAPVIAPGHTRMRLSILLWIGGLLLVGYAGGLTALYLMQRRFIYLPDRRTPDPAASGVPNVVVGRIRTADGLSLLAWYAPPARSDGCVVVYLHGNGGHIGYRAERLLRFTALGWGVLLPEYRGYGGNPGTPSEAGLWRDTQAALAQVRAMGVPPKRILLWGESLGTGLAVRLGAENEVAALLLESPYTSLVAMGRRQFPWAPVGLLLQDRFDSLARIGAVKAPILVMQGDRDRLVPPAMGQRLLAAAHAPAQLWHAREAGHNDLDRHGMIEAAAAFVASACGEQGRKAGNHGLRPDLTRT